MKKKVALVKPNMTHWWSYNKSLDSIIKSEEALRAFGNKYTAQLRADGKNRLLGLISLFIFYFLFFQGLFNITVLL